MQRATSIDDQVDVARRHAAAQGWEVLEDHVYKDEAISGASLEGRPRVQALMASAASKPRPFDALLVDDSSRVARDLADALRFMQLLRFHGIRVLYLSQQIDSGDEQAETMVAVHGIVDGLYLREMAKKIKRGLAGQLVRGFATGGRTFGYRTTPTYDPSGRVDSYGARVRVGCELAIHPAEAETVRRIFERYAAGTGVGTIVEELNRSRRPGPQGKPWQYGAVARVLRNERYRGRQVWGQRRVERRPGSRRVVLRPVPPEQWYTRDRPDLCIIEDDVWHRAQARIAEVSRTAVRQPSSNLLRGRSGAVRSPHLFSGLMTCSVCGLSIGVVSGGAGSPRYGCRHSWRNGLSACTNRLTVRAKIADAALVEGLQAQLLRADTLAYVTDALSAKIAAALDEGPRRRQRLEADRAKVQQQLGNLVNALEALGPTAELVQRMRTRDAELSHLQRELDAVHEPLSDKLAVLPSWVQSQLSDVAGLLRDTPEHVRAHLRRVGVCFTVSPVTDEGRPFLRAVGTVNLLGAVFEGETDLSATGRSHPRSGQ